jgi:hypothetical protein
MSWIFDGLAVFGLAVIAVGVALWSVPAALAEIIRVVSMPRHENDLPIPGSAKHGEQGCTVVTMPVGGSPSPSGGRGDDPAEGDLHEQLRAAAKFYDANSSQFGKYGMTKQEYIDGYRNARKSDPGLPFKEFASAGRQRQ